MTPLRQPAAPVRQPVARVARRHGHWAALLGAVALVVGCGGGGGDTGDTGATASAAYTQGTINGFGSVIVNGIRFADTGAHAYDDDAGTGAQDPSVLRLGMSVTVSSGAIDGKAAHATEFHYGGQVLGPVTAVDVVDASSGSFTLLGQAVDVNSATVFDDALAGGITALKTALDLAGATGTVLVEVHGVPDSASGHIVATRVESKTTVKAYKLVGTVASLDTTAKTFVIGGATISYQTFAASNAVPGTLVDGATLRVLLATTPNAQGQWVATSLGGKSKPVPTDNTAAHLRGRITAFTSTTHFSVDGFPVDASGVSTIPAGLALGTVVEVEGTVSGGVLVATQVSLEEQCRTDDSRRPQLIGAITAVNTADSSFDVRGVTVTYDSSTTFSPSGKTAADLVQGATVSVKASVGRRHSQVKASEITITTAASAS